MSTERRLLTVKQVQEITGMSIPAIYRMAQSETLPSLKIGRSLKVPLDQLEKWISAKTRGGIAA